MTCAPTVRALGYVRVSSTEQAESGLGLTAQRSAITAECDRRGWILETIEADEGVSGKVAPEKRPALSRALTALDKDEADVLVVARLDRLSRSVPDFASALERAKKKAWAVVCLDVAVDTTTPTGELLVNVLAAVAQFERKLIGARTKEALAAKKAEGAVLGQPDNPREVPDALVQRIRDKRADGASLRHIARFLNDEGTPTPRGGRWHSTTVGRVADEAFRLREAERAEQRRQRRESLTLKINL